MRLFKLALISCSILVANLAKAQLTEDEVRDIAATANEPELVMQSSTLTQEGYLYYASILVDKLIELKPQSSNYNYRKRILAFRDLS
jgi:hypothetical protein